RLRAARDFRPSGSGPAALPGNRPKAGGSKEIEGSAVMNTRPVIVGTDGTESSRAAVEWAAREAQRRGLLLRIAHVYEWEWEGARYNIGYEYIDVPRQLAEAAISAALGQARQVAPHIPIETDGLI